MDGTEIYNNFTAGNSETLQAASESIQQLADGYNEEFNAIKALQARMNAAWTGSSGDAANAGANPLAQAFDDSRGPLIETQGSMQAQSDVFEASKSKVVPVPPAPEKPSGWSVGLKAAIPIVGPSMAIGDVKSYQDGVAKTNAANENNVRVMDQYSSVTGDTKGIIPMDYKTLPSDGATIGLKSQSVGTIGTSTSRYNDNTNASSATTQPTGGSLGGGPVSAAPNLSGSSPVTSSSPVTTGGTSGSVSPLPNLPGNTPTTSSPTSSSSFFPGATPGYGGTSDETQRTGRSPGRGLTSSGGSAANRLYSNESEGRGGSAAKEGRGSSSAKESISRGGAAAGENARELGAGKNTGSGKFASAAAAEEAAASRSAAKGSSGSAMGAAGQRGKGEEDEEHQRPDYLLEADPDSVFGSDVRATPPVIGE
ncbi:WXG100 family type VII secretion target [Amycolatopsis sp.]|uniref:WXG100 family type VII secretion target n=1 Tax=Amycolatopsis sp. TaxID=37632 RepID=UPI002BBB9E6A|nr:WXG100 family type VII secretion target [Amycolatopsis sp.]HVV12856.1 WXG100 family type VII secretion target [Amycolatopsis sp.]